MRGMAIHVPGLRYLSPRHRIDIGVWGWKHCLTCLLLACLLWLLQAPDNRVQAQTAEEVLVEYTVQEGDTLLRIAARFAVPLPILQALNGLEGDSPLIVLGQILLIPRVAQPEPSCRTWYVVEPGDSLWSIANSWDWTVADLARVNEIGNQDLITEGQRLCMDGTSTGDVPPAAQPSTPQEFPWVIHATESFWYTVNLGDTLAWIALRYNQTEDQLREANELPQESEVVPGQLLWIPGQETGTEGPTAQQPWTARYYPVPDLTGEPALLRYEEAIAHNWFNGAPDPALPADSFSAQWEGEFDFTNAVYRFIGIADHGVRVYLGDQRIVDNWSPQDQLVPYVEQEVIAGTHNVRVEYREQTGAALIYVAWFHVPVTNTE